MAQSVEKLSSVNIKYGIDAEAKRVVVLFNQNLNNLMLTPEEAAMLARNVLENVQRVNPAAAQGFTWPSTQ